MLKGADIFSSVAYSRDGKLLAVGSWDRTIPLWEAATGRLIQSFRDHRNPVPVHFLEFTPDGRSLASTGGLSSGLRPPTPRAWIGSNQIGGRSRLRQGTRPGWVGRPRSLCKPSIRGAF